MVKIVEKPVSTILAAARRYVAAGFSVIPIRAGSKQPAVKWAVYQERLPTDAELVRWFGEEEYRIAVVTGKVSGNLEIMDFDDIATFNEFRRLVNDNEELAEVGAKTPVARTPSGAYHVFYRTEETTPGSTVFARLPDKSVRIESRGEGGYALVEPSDGYEFLHMALTGSEPISRRERSLFVDLAKTFNAFVEEFETVHGYQESRTDGRLRPGDDFNQRGDIRPYLEEAGWRSVGHNGEAELWTRPGTKSGDPHATLGLGGQPIFYVFSSNSAPFAPNRAYSFFSVYSILKHRADFKAAASALAAEGYGDPLEPTGVEISVGGEFERILPISSHILPTFPKGVFPPWSEDFINAVAESTQTPPDLGAMLTLSTYAASLAKTVEVFPRADWSEPVNLYTVCALPPGSRKSSVFSLIAKPLLEYERRINRDNKIALAQSESEKIVLEGRLQRARAEATKSSPEMWPEHQENLRQISIQMEEVEAKSARPVRLVADDVTPEKLANLLAEHDGKMAVLSSDTDIFSMMAGKYSGGVPNLDVYLKGHAGDDLKVDRVGREADLVEKPALTLGFSVQPDLLQGLMKARGFRGRGIIGRWLYSLPEDKIGYRSFKTPPVPPHLITQFRDHVERLAAMKPEIDSFGGKHAHAMTFSDAAFDRYWEWAESIEHRQRPGGDLDDMKDWASKLHGLVARLSALLHVTWKMDEVDAPWSEPIGLETLEKAIQIAKYAILHSKAAFAEMGADETMNKARIILNWLRRSPRGEFVRRDIQRYLPTTFLRREDLDNPLKILVDRGYIRLIEAEGKNERGRPKSERYEVNPKFLEDEPEQTVVQVSFEEICGDDPNCDEVGK